MRQLSPKQMLEFAIAVDGWPYTPEQLWNLSPTGEVGHCFFLYWAARRKASPWPQVVDRDRESSPSVGSLSNDYASVWTGMRWQPC